MKVRSDSPFANLTDEEKEIILDMAEAMKLPDLADHIESKFGVTAGVSVAALKRFLRRLRTEKAVEEAEEADEAVQALARRAKDSRAREAALEAARQKMCALAVGCENREELGAMIKTLSEEKAREHELMMRERQMAIAEEQAKLSWRKLECENARAGLKALPRIREILVDSSMTAEDRISAALQWLGRDVVSLLPERTAERAPAAA